MCLGLELCLGSSKLLFPFVPAGSALALGQDPEAELGSLRQSPGGGWWMFCTLEIPGSSGVPLRTGGAGDACAAVQG